MAIFNNVSALDTIVGPYSAGWSQVGFTAQQLVSAAQTAATGGTYAITAPVKETVAEAPKPKRKYTKKTTAKIDSPKETVKAE